MWLTERRKVKNKENMTGTVTLSGEKCAVMDFSEHRNIAVYTPGGYCWMPCVGDEVLVLKDGGIVGMESEAAGLLPGEVCIRSNGGAEIRLLNDGTVHIKGKIIEED
ncbi:MAG: hypothetical protein IJ017_07155 [Oscillospiraceae bacterium]|nr:hypothetical protein [Oscillospiraceae bacterium]